MSVCLSISGGQSDQGYDSLSKEEERMVGRDSDRTPLAQEKSERESCKFKHVYYSRLLNGSYQGWGQCHFNSESKPHSTFSSLENIEDNCNFYVRSELTELKWNCPILTSRIGMKNSSKIITSVLFISKLCYILYCSYSPNLTEH